ncbi:MAG: hypothetical protein HY520_02430 [Candidatus Aenigmarchaeota archaeon]|nr:hypothetical protein [Candidatus Aenigmarchaeota archaeon]
MTHVKRYRMPAYWGMGVKEKTFAIVPRGAHPQQASIPLAVALRNLLHVAGDRAEARRILQAEKVLVNKVVRKDVRLGIGLMDLLEIPELGKVWRVELTKHGLALRETASGDQKLCKVMGKTTLRGGKLQVNLHDGRNLLLDAACKRGDSLLLSLPGRQLLQHYPLQEGADVLITAGSKRGLRGTVQALQGRTHMEGTATATLDVEGQRVETLQAYLFVIGQKGEAKAGGRSELRDGASGGGLGENSGSPPRKRARKEKA